MYWVEEVFKKKDKSVSLITVKNRNNITLKLLNLGATLVELSMPDREEKVENIILTHKNIEDYIENPSYFGATIGRTSGRISEGKFQLDDVEYHLNKNYGINHGHGGLKGFSSRIWHYTIVEKPHETIVEFEYLSKDGEENYPGNMKIHVRYILSEENKLSIEYRAKTDTKTLCNLTNHSYFNLSGNYKRKVTQQYLILHSENYLELNDSSTPTGKLISVENTPMDFRHKKRIGRDINKDYLQLNLTKGYDHTWRLKDRKNQIEMIDEVSGRKMSIKTTYPSVVVYSFNFPNGEILKGGKKAEIQDGICFETQFEPDGINHNSLHSAILNPGEVYYHKTEYTFLIV